MLKRTLSLIMALALCLSWLPVEALAEDSYVMESVQLKSDYLAKLTKTYDGARVQAPTVDDLVVTYKDGKTPPAGTTYTITSTTWKKGGTALTSAPSAAGTYTLEVGVSATIPTSTGRQVQASAQAVFATEGDAETGPDAAGEYTVTIDPQIANGTVTASVGGISVPSGGKVKKGQTVILTVEPVAGYEMGEVKIKENNAIMQTGTIGGMYSFEMPEGDVTITATFKKLYKITVDPKTTNGTIESFDEQNRSEASEGSPVYMTVKPAENYKLNANSLKIKKADGEFLATSQFKLRDGATDVYEFFMPASDVTVTGEFVSEGTPTIDLPTFSGMADDETANVTFKVNGQETTTPTADEEVTIEITPPRGKVTQTVAVTEKAATRTTGNVTVTEVAKNQYTFTMPNSDIQVAVTFTDGGTQSDPDTYTVTVPPNLVGGNKIEADQTTAKVGDEVTLTITLSEGYKLGSLKVTQGDGSEVTVTDNKFTMPAGDVKVEATFIQEKVRVSVVSTIEHGNIEIQGQNSKKPPYYMAVPGEEIILIAKPDSGYNMPEANTIKVYYDSITEKKDLPVTKEEEGKYAFTMPAPFPENDAVIVQVQAATFTAGSQQQYKVTVEPATNGTITADKTTDVAAGDTVTLTATPDGIYMLAKLTVQDAAGKEIPVQKTNGKENEYTFPMPASNVTVSGEFKEARTVTVDGNIKNGNIAADPVKAVAGQTVTLTPKPAGGFAVKEITYTYTLGGTEETKTVTADKGGIYSFTMPDADVTVSATFMQANYYTVKLGVLTNGTASLSHESAPEGQKIVVTATPNSGYQVSGVSYTPEGENKTSVLLQDGEYAFKMPGANVTVMVDFQPLPPGTATGTATAAFTIAPREITPVLKDNITKAYDGNTTLAVSATTRPADSPIDYDKSGVLSNDHSVLFFTGSFVFDSPAVGTGKTLTATELALAGDAAGNYKLKETTASTAGARITKGKVTGMPSCTLVLRNRREYTYTYDLKQMLPALEEGELGEVIFTLGEINITRPSFLTARDVSLNEDGETLTLKVSSAPYDRDLEVGTIMVTIESENFEPFQNILQLKSSNKIPVTVTGIQPANSTYDGSEKMGFSGTPSCVFTDPSTPGVPEVEEMAYSYKGIRGTVYAQNATPPTEPGTYQVTVSVPDSNGDYVGQWVGEFIIEKATVTIQVLDKTIKVDDPIPDLSKPVLGKDYTVSGLAPGHELRVPPTLEYFPLADSIMAGEFDILAMDASVPNNTRYFPEITYIKGKLTVESVAPDVTLPFSDVSPDAWYANAVKYVYGYDMMSGVGHGLFGPTVLTSRGMLVTVLYRMEGRPAVWGTVDFEDVDPDSFYYDAIRWASSNRIISGYGNGKFGPDDNLTREQLAAILYNYTRYYKGINTNRVSSLDHFKDMDQVGDWAMRSVQWAYAQGLVVGRSDTVLAPKGLATRAEMASILMRYCMNICPPSAAE